MKKFRFDTKLAAAAGLTTKEIRAYTAMLEGGPASVTSIARRAQLYRPEVYAALTGLKKDNLVVVTGVGKRRVFAAAPVARLRRVITDRLAEVPKLLAALEKPSQETSLPKMVRYFHGKAGLRSVLVDLLVSVPKGAIFYRLSSRKADTDVESFIPKNYRIERDRKKIQQFVITSAGRPYKRRLESLSRTVPQDGEPFDYNIVQLMYGDKLAIVDYENEEAVVIESPRLVRFHERVFKLLFQRL